jgi:hypothetical protein
LADPEARSISYTAGRRLANSCCGSVAEQMQRSLDAGELDSSSAVPGNKLSRRESLHGNSDGVKPTVASANKRYLAAITAWNCGQAAESRSMVRLSRHVTSCRLFVDKIRESAKLGEVPI